MNQILTALTECRKRIEVGLGPNENCMNRDLIKQGIFGLYVMEIMLSEPRQKIQGPEVHVIQMDGINMPYPFNSFVKKIKEQIEQMQEHKTVGCPKCGNEEISPKAKYCKICGLSFMGAGSSRPKGEK